LTTTSDNKSIHDEELTKKSEVTSQNQTYQRALEVFFQGENLSKEIKQRLPNDVEGLSIKRKTMVDAVKQAPSEKIRLEALSKLQRAFGLPQDLEMIYYALSPEQDYLNLVALQTLQIYLNGNVAVGAWEERLIERLQSIQVRSFDQEILNHIDRCLDLIR
jgi:hypothetical protein